MTRFLAGTCALIMVVLVAGCGNDGNSSSTTANASATISKAQYVKRADAICSQTEKKQLKLVANFPKSKPTHQAQVELVEHAGIPPLQVQAKELGELPPPEEDAAQAQGYVMAFSAGVKTSEEDPGAMLEAPSPFVKAEALAAAFGFKVCSGA